MPRHGKPNPPSRRIARLAVQLRAAVSAPLSARPPAPPLEVVLSTAPARLLDSSQVRSFISNGFLELDLDEVPPEFHRAVHDPTSFLTNNMIGAKENGPHTSQYLSFYGRLYGGNMCNVKT